MHHLPVAHLSGPPDAPWTPAPAKAEGCQMHDFMVRGEAHRASLVMPLISQTASTKGYLASAFTTL